MNDSASTNSALTVNLRFFAGAAQAFGTKSAQIKLQKPNGEYTLADLLQALKQGAIPTASAEASQVLARCSFLIDSISHKDPQAKLLSADGSLPTALPIDVLPPFAGG